MVSELSIRTMKSLDMDELVKLIHTTIKECYPLCYKQEVVNFFVDYHCREELLRKARDGKFLVAFSGRELVASGYLVGKEIGGVYVHPDYQKQGIAPKMVEALMSEAHHQKLSSVWLESTPIALKLYLRLGFVIEEECVMYVENNTPLPYYHMVKELASTHSDG